MVTIFCCTGCQAGDAKPKLGW